MRTGPNDSNRLDPTCILSAIALAIHCLIAPALPASLGGSWAHGLLASTTGLISLIGILLGSFIHGEGRIWAWAIPGWILILVARFGGSSSNSDSELSEILLTVSASGILIFAHCLNRSLRYWHLRL